MSWPRQGSERREAWRLAPNEKRKVCLVPRQTIQGLFVFFFEGGGILGTQRTNHDNPKNPGCPSCKVRKTRVPFPKPRRCLPAALPQPARGVRPLRRYEAREGDPKRVAMRWYLASLGSKLINIPFGPKTLLRFFPSAPGNIKSVWWFSSIVIPCKDLLNRQVNQFNHVSAAKSQWLFGTAMAVGFTSVQASRGLRLALMSAHIESHRQWLNQTHVESKEHFPKVSSSGPGKHCSTPKSELILTKPRM